ncbi:MAG TPA: hypothetical protein VGN57_01540 [Pirellulaceae bacterium]|nr:hypothetical protein [Pirellulaceae bacterium]
MLRNIIGSAFLFATMFNSQLTWNADKFDNDPVAFDARVTAMHTVEEDGVIRFFKPAKEANMVELSKFFGMIRR